MDYTTALFCEVDKYAAESYCAVHGVDHSLNIGDITQADEKSAPDFNTMFGGSPCFPAGTLVLTHSGYKCIEDLSLSDAVITHTGDFSRIRRIGKTDEQPILRLKAQGNISICATPNHPFWVRTKSKYEITPPYWKELQDIDVNDYIGVPILRSDEYVYYVWVPEFVSGLTEEECWIIGRYIADGYLRKNEIVLCIGKEKVDDLNVIKSHKYKLLRKSASCFGCHIKDEYLLDLIKNIGLDKKAHEKQIHIDFLTCLNEHQLRHLLDGYFSGDGCVIGNHVQATTVSRKLALTLSLAWQKAYKSGCNIYFDKRDPKHIIQGRVANQRDTYMFRAALHPTGHEYYIVDTENNCIWYPVRKVENLGQKMDVYNIEVDDMHTYIANNIVVHNCQDFSIAGKQGGASWTCKDCGLTYNPLEAHYLKRNKCPQCGSTTIEKTRSSLLVEWLRFLREKKPRFAIYENVKNIVGARFKETFDLFVRELEEYGYNVYWQVLNAKNYGIPQNRERVYCVIIRKDLDNGQFKFPEPIPLKSSLSDLLEDEVDERYYLSDEKVAQMIAPTP